MKDRDRIIVEKIMDYCEEIIETNQEFDDDEQLFMSDRGFVYRNAVSMPVQQIGELAKSLTDEFVLEHKDIPFKEIKGMRDWFAHGYGDMDRAQIWKTAHEDVTELKEKLEDIMKNS